MSEKQDRVYPRTALDIERKYNFGKTYAQLMGIAEDHQKSIEEITNITVELSENIDNITARVENTETGLSQTIRVRADGILIKNQNNSVLEIDGGQLKADSSIMSPKIYGGTIYGGTIYGGKFYDDDRNVYFELQGDREGSYGFVLTTGYLSPGYELFKIYNGDTSSTSFSAKGNSFMTVGGNSVTFSNRKNSVKFYGTVDLSEATVIYPEE